ncbi:hypothetical protein DMA12_40195 [Amycolatopsis balhimycina DSM 5908]|uniref:Uncharacterized protein n=1 Tax=Amycolatopsis balhimycina DSM 5908 TaxID=1081091 RepID=A0A428W051_AMYBA|nr:hypothetical protein DMA12_40195 [Amycolatopsis balhimycina DSM 5908]
MVILDRCPCSWGERVASRADVGGPGQSDAGEADFAELDPGVWSATAVRTCSVCDGQAQVLGHGGQVVVVGGVQWRAVADQAPPRRGRV